MSRTRASRWVPSTSIERTCHGADRSANAESSRWVTDRWAVASDRCTAPNAFRSPADCTETSTPLTRVLRISTSVTGFGASCPNPRSRFQPPCRVDITVGPAKANTANAGCLVNGKNHRPNFPGPGSGQRFAFLADGSAGSKVAAHTSPKPVRLTVCWSPSPARSSRPQSAAMRASVRQSAAGARSSGSSSRACTSARRSVPATPHTSRIRTPAFGGQFPGPRFVAVMPARLGQRHSDPDSSRFYRRGRPARHPGLPSTTTAGPRRALDPRGCLKADNFVRGRTVRAAAEAVCSGSAPSP